MPWEGVRTLTSTQPVTATTQSGTWAAPSFSQAPSSPPSVGEGTGHAERGNRGWAFSLGKRQGEVGGTRQPLDLRTAPLPRLWQCCSAHRCRAPLLHLLCTGGDPAVRDPAGRGRGPAGLLPAPRHRSHRSHLSGEQFRALVLGSEYPSLRPLFRT